MLLSRYVGVVIPPLPEKKAMGNKSADFIRLRMRSLGMFMVRVVLNPYLKVDVSTSAFLSVNDSSEWEKIKKASERPFPRL